MAKDHAEGEFHSRLPVMATVADHADSAFGENPAGGSPRLPPAAAILTRASTFDLISLVEESPLGVFQTTPAGRFRYANRGLADILGYNSQKELIDSIKDISQELLVDASSRTEVLRD